MIKMRNIIVVLVWTLMLTTVCSATTYNVEAPSGIHVAPGGSVDYKIIVSDTALPSEDFDFSVNPADMLSNWTYTFAPSQITVLSSGSDSTVLTIGVPTGTTAGTYQHHVIIEGSYYSIPADLTMEVVKTEVTVPEFSTVAVPMFAILGLLTIFGRRNGKQ